MKLSLLRNTSLRAILLASLLASPAANPADVQRGQLLYENHCVDCHDSRAHVRDNRKASSLADVREWVGRWSRTLALAWSDDDRDDVAGFVYDQFYKKQE